MTHPKDWTYFSVHILADKEHAESERRLLGEYVNSGNIANVQQSVQRVLDKLWDFLTSLCHRYNISCQVPA
jgi:pyrroloquinoline-quinone synthase